MHLEREREREREAVVLKASLVLRRAECHIFKYIHCISRESNAVRPFPN